jgi:hypothetical protein
MISSINVSFHETHLTINHFILAGARGGAQPVERYVPPPPPTSEADIFGEAVSKGENFGKYHRTQVRCTPEGNSNNLFLSFFF